MYWSELAAASVPDQPGKSVMEPLGPVDGNQRSFSQSVQCMLFTLLLVVPRPSRLDGYSFIFPEQWAAVTSSGNDISLRNPFDVDQNLFVGISSPSSSR